MFTKILAVAVDALLGIAGVAVGIAIGAFLGIAGTASGNGDKPDKIYSPSREHYEAGRIHGVERREMVAGVLARYGGGPYREGADLYLQRKNRA